MKWLEIIELRPVATGHELLESEFLDLIAEIDQEANLVAIKIYNHATVKNDISIHLLNDSEQANINGSPLALRLAAALKEFGLINHNVWIEWGGQ